MAQYLKLGVIGLGGSGKLVVLHLKRLLAERFGDTGFPATGWHVIDSDPTVPVLTTRNGAEIRLDAEEMSLLSRDDIADYQYNAGNNPAGYGYLREWWPTSRLNNPLFAAQGAGAAMTGAFGRLMLHRQISAPVVGGSPVEPVNTLVQTLGHKTLQKRVDDYLTNKGLLRNLEGPIPNSPPVIVVTGSICGGTGRGTFMDIGMQARGAGIVDLWSIMMSSSIYAEHSSIQKNPSSVGKVYSNAFAAMQELEVIQRILQQPYRVSCDDGGHVFTFNGANPLFDLVCFIGRKNDSWTLAPGDAGVDEAAQLIALFLASLQFDFGANFNAERVNLYQELQPAPVNINGVYRGRARYASIGYSRVALPPLKDLADHLAGQIVREMLEHVVIGGASALDGSLATSEVPALGAAFTQLRSVDDPSDDVNRLLAFECTSAEQAKAHLAAIGSLDERINTPLTVTQTHTDANLGGYKGLLDRISAATASVASCPIGLKAVAAQCGRLEARLGADRDALDRCLTALQAHLAEAERLEADRVRYAGIDDAGADLRVLRRRRAERVLREASVYWETAFDVDADGLVRAVDQHYRGYAGRPFTSTTPDLAVREPGNDDYRKLQVLRGVVEHCRAQVENARTRVEQLIDRASRSLALLDDPVLASYRVLDSRQSTFEDLCMPPKWLNERVRTPAVGADLARFAKDVLRTTLMELLNPAPGAAQTDIELLKNVLREVAHIVEESGEAHNYNATNLQTDNAFITETHARISDAELEAQAMPAQDFSFAAGPKPTRLGNIMRTWESGANALSVREGPRILSYRLTLGVVASQLAETVQAAGRGNLTHTAHVDRVLRQWLGTDDITDSSKLICPNCGADHENERASWLKALGTLDKSALRCPDCQSYLDGSWECTGTGTFAHSRRRHGSRIDVCPEGSGAHRCSGTRPGYTKPAFCPGCLRAAGLEITTANPPLSIHPLDGAMDQCPNGHRVTVVCPYCQQDDTMASRTERDPRRGNTSVAIYTCGKADCVRATSGYPWTPCPECGYPLQAPTADSFGVCPACEARVRVCAQCDPANPWRVLKQPETTPGQPDMSAAPTCGVHGPLPLLL